MSEKCKATRECSWKKSVTWRGRNFLSGICPTLPGYWSDENILIIVLTGIANYLLVENWQRFVQGRHQILVRLGQWSQRNTFPSPFFHQLFAVKQAQIQVVHLQLLAQQISLACQESPVFVIDSLTKSHNCPVLSQCLSSIHCCTLFWHLPCATRYLRPLCSGDAPANRT